MGGGEQGKKEDGWTPHRLEPNPTHPRGSNYGDSNLHQDAHCGGSTSCFQCHQSHLCNPSPTLQLLPKLKTLPAAGGKPKKIEFGKGPSSPPPFADTTTSTQPETQFKSQLLFVPFWGRGIIIFTDVLGGMVLSKKVGGLKEHGIVEHDLSCHPPNMHPWNYLALLLPIHPLKHHKPVIPSNIFVPPTLLPLQPPPPTSPLFHQIKFDQNTNHYKTSQPPLTQEASFLSPRICSFPSSKRKLKLN